MAYATFEALLEAAGDGSLGEAAIARETAESGAARAEVVARLDEALLVMEAAVARGLSGDARSRSGLIGGDARRVVEGASGLAGDTFTAAIAGALAVAEVNAAMGRVVAAPTGGASGVLPGVLLATATRLGSPRERVVLALACAGAVGGVIAARAALAGHAASFALQGLLGLVCDPVGGLVEVPCVARNATATGVALAAAELALSGVEFPIPFDEVARAMGSVGRSLPPSLRETALGGLAVTPTGKKLAGG
jgi:L-serine dehydratase